MPRGYRGTGMNGWGKKQRRGSSFSKGGKDFYRRQLINIGVCIVLVLVILLLKSLKYPFAQETANQIKESLNLNYSLVDLAKSWPDVKEGVVSVFNQNKKPKADTGKQVMIFPAKGDIILSYGNVTHPVFGTTYQNEGINIQPSKEEILCSFDGKVEEVGNQDGQGRFVVISHDDGLKTYYKNLDLTNLKKGDELKAGDVVGTMDVNNHEKFFRFEVTKLDQPMDPVELFNSYSSPR